MSREAVILAVAVAAAAAAAATATDGDCFDVVAGRPFCDGHRVGFAFTTAQHSCCGSSCGSDHDAIGCNDGGASGFFSPAPAPSA
mmetsp:Transcript_61050/g.119745  ORF Transcript_61050/g.119745 Transcript_61050/m.119745 type:complete len:85 (+) Transcript_61050:501-755(+)